MRLPRRTHRWLKWRHLVRRHQGGRAGRRPNAEHAGAAERPTGPGTGREIAGFVRGPGPVAPAGPADPNGPGLVPDLGGLGVFCVGSRPGHPGGGVRRGGSNIPTGFVGRPSLPEIIPCAAAERPPCSGRTSRITKANPHRQKPRESAVGSTDSSADCVTMGCLSAGIGRAFRPGRKSIGLSSLTPIRIGRERPRQARKSDRLGSDGRKFSLPGPQCERPRTDGYRRVLVPFDGFPYPRAPRARRLRLFACNLECSCPKSPHFVHIPY